MSIEKLDRNREIYVKYKSGVSYLNLAREYGLSESRIRQIIDQVSYQKRHQTEDVKEIAIACQEFGATEWMNGRIQSALRQRRLNVQNKWRRLSRNDILSLRNIGEKAADIIEYAQKIN